MDKQKLNGLQILRAIAALSVVFHHCVLELVHYFSISDKSVFFKTSFGASAGVDLFFILSGFVITYISYNKKLNPLSFILKRILRIGPVYWFYTTFALIIIVFAGTAVKRSTGISIPYIIGSYLFYPMARPNDNIVQPVLGLGWTLNYELFFYVLFSIALLAKKQFREWCVCGLIILSVLIGFFTPAGYTAIHYWTNPIIIEFTYGIIMALVYIKGFRINNFLAIMLIVISVIMWFIVSNYFIEYTGDVRALTWGLCALGMVAGTVLTRKIADEKKYFVHLLTKIGDWSFSLYLLHIFVIRIVTLAIIKTHIISIIIIPFEILLIIILSVFLSFLSFNFIEKKFLKLNIK